MSGPDTKEVATTTQRTLVQWTDEQKQLIMRTVAKKATPDEFKLFLYRCQHMELDPLVPGMVHFVKYDDNSPGTIVVGIDGFRLRAHRTGKHNGTKRGVLFNEKGQCVGAWCEVYRTDWDHPAREEVSLAEYTNGKKMWTKMPQTMIKKVAEAAALRMAFPDALGGVYAQEEMDRAEHESDMRNKKDVTPDAGVPKSQPEAKPVQNVIQKPSSQPAPAAQPKVDFRKLLSEIAVRSEERGISREDLSNYVSRTYKVENAHKMTGKQILDLHGLVMDEGTDIKLFRYLSDPDAFNQEAEGAGEEPDGTESFRC